MTVFPKYISKHLMTPAVVVSWYWCSQLKAKFWSESGFRFVPWPHNGWPDKLRLGLENLDFQIGSLWGFEISQFWRSQISGFAQIWLAIGQGSFYSIVNGLSIESIARKDILDKEGHPCQLEEYQVVDVQMNQVSRPTITATTNAMWLRPWLLWYLW